jgi:hypothetical protein
MKKFVAGLVVLMAALEAGAQEAPIALRESSWPEPGRLTEMLALHDLRGGVYIPYIAEDAFALLRAGADGQLSPYAPEGFDGVSATARKLKIIDGGSERYIAFIGRSGGGESIQLLGFGFWEDMAYCPLPATSATVISDYSLVPSGDGVAVYTLAGGMLRSFSTGIRGLSPGRSAEISRQGENVEAFGVFREQNQEITRGWYRVARQEYWEMTLFSQDDAGNLVLEKIGSLSRVPRLDYGVSPEGNAVFVVTAGSAVSVFHAEGPLFALDFRLDAPVAAKRHSPALLTGASIGLLIGETEGAEVLYGVSHERSGAPSLRELFARPSAEILELFCLDRDRVSLVYRSGQALFAALIDAKGGIIADGPLPGAAPGAALFRHPLAHNRVCAVSEAPSGELSILSVLEFEGETWRQTEEARIPRIVAGEIHSLAGVRNDGLFLVTSPEAIMLVDTATSASQIVETENHDATIALNGVVYLATSSEDGIVLCRIEGAL